MLHPESGYAHHSAVGPVFDVTKWSGRGHIPVGLTGLMFTVLVLVSTAYVWQPPRLLPKPPPAVTELNGGIRKAWRAHPRAMQFGVAFGALIGVRCLLGVSNLLTDAFRREYFLRAGPGGLWLRMPMGAAWQYLGLISRAVELELPWDKIKNYEITQVKRLGSLSRNSGNLYAELKLETDWQRYVFGLSGLEAPAYLICERLNEARFASLQNPFAVLV